MTRQQLHGIAALLLIGAGGLFLFTDTLPPAFAGLGIIVAAALIMAYAWYRDRNGDRTGDRGT